MQILHVNQSDLIGGAAKAAARIHRALLAEGAQSRMLVEDGGHAVPATIRGPGRRDRLAAPLRAKAADALTARLVSDNPVMHEPALFSSGSRAALARTKADIVNLHWVSGNMLSVDAIGKITAPVVWTLHDMWAFCGAEHYAEDTRWRDGYLPNNRPPGERGFDINRWTWERKRRAWRRPMHIVTPSRWLAGLVRDSALMRGWPVEVIPNAIDTAIWVPGDRTAARRLLGLPEDRPVLLFGAMGGDRDPRKGFDLLVGALTTLKARGDTPDRGEPTLLVFGRGAEEGDVPALPFPARYMGHLQDDLSLRLLYVAADLFVLPSRIDNLPNTAVESLACGTPVVGFDNGGMPDLVRHGETGYLARPGDSDDLAHGLREVLARAARPEAARAMATAARAHAEAHFAPVEVARRYLELYRRLLPDQTNM